MAKKSPIMPSAPMERYHTPRRMIGGHSGNITAARRMTTIPSPMSWTRNCDPSKKKA